VNYQNFHHGLAANSFISALFGKVCSRMRFESPASWVRPQLLVARDQNAERVFVGRRAWVVQQRPCARFTAAM